MDMVLEMLFLPLPDTDIRVAERLVWRSYTIQRPCLLGPTKRVKFVDGKKFAAVASDQLFEDTCLGPVGHQGSALEFAVATVVQEAEMLGRYGLLSGKGMRWCGGSTHHPESWAQISGGGLY